MNETKPQVITVSVVGLLKIIGVLLALWFLYLVRDVAAMLFVSFILASAFDGWVDWLQKHRIPRAVGILLIYVVIIGAFSTIISLVVPLLIKEIRGLAVDFPAYWNAITSSVLQLQVISDEAGFLSHFQKLLTSVEGTLVSTGQSVLGSIFSLFGGLVRFIVVLVLTFYMTIDESSVKRVVRSFLSEEYQPYITSLINRIQERIGVWLQGQLTLSIIIAALVYLGLTLIGVKYALILALLAGLLEFVPYVGPILSAIPAIFFGFTQAPSTAGLVLIMYIVIQQLENNLIVPAVMRRALGIHPIISISAILIGAKLFGFLGVLLAVPVVTTIMAIVQSTFEKEQEA